MWVPLPCVLGWPLYIRPCASVVGLGMLVHIITVLVITVLYFLLC